MANDDLSSWLKVAAENKITIKNTWKSTLIEHFTDIKQFKEMQGINFQKASCTLDGCVKVYSTRVDDISEEALKLLDGFSIEEETKKKSSKRRGTSTLEKCPANLNIRTASNALFRDPRFTSISKQTESTLMLSSLDISLDGVFRLSMDQECRNIILCNYQIDLYNCEDKLICPNLDTGAELLPQLEEEQIMEEQILEDNLQLDQDFDDLIFDGSIGEDSQQKTPVYKETPFSYFKGWGGPSQWKIRSRRAQKQQPTQKPKEKFFIDFFESLDVNKIIETGDTLFNQVEIQKRKEKIHNLPEDFNFEMDDLFNFNLLDRSFRRKQHVEIIHNDISVLVENTPLPVEEPIDETFIDLQKDANKDVVLPYKKEQKKVDIKKLKQNIFTTLKNRDNVKLSDICHEVPRMYNDKEGKDISVHFCIVSLLHLAHENNLLLEESGSDIVVHK
ncbi:Condensin complex subunit 2 [Nosema granulosis]|uniref:Condensin complex subunit 2 n=1 Tax=Nosema granulosis TaxID=83296 RepID=A0A9P6KYW2_9MICR|nr:Condensin complex subunit 2 [Nosema granulosis]